MGQEPPFSQDNSVNELLAGLNSASSSVDSHLLDFNPSLTGAALSAAEKTSLDSSLIFQDGEELERSLIETPTPSQASTSKDFESWILDSTSRDETSTRALKSSKEALIPATPNKREIPWYKQKKGKKPNKLEEDKWKEELEMWNASDSTVLEHLLYNKGHVTKWQAIATARGLCSLSNNCCCPDCKSSYVTFDNDGDGGMMACGF